MKMIIVFIALAANTYMGRDFILIWRDLLPKQLTIEQFEVFIVCPNITWLPRPLPDFLFCFWFLNLFMAEFFCVFFFKFWRTSVLFWGYWYSWFGLPVMSALRVQATAHPLLRWISQIHLWCDTCWPLGNQHGRKVICDPHMCHDGQKWNATALPWHPFGTSYAMDGCSCPWHTLA